MQVLPFLSLSLSLGLTPLPHCLSLTPGPGPWDLRTVSLRTAQQLRTLSDLRGPATLLRATALELAILAGHVLLYPSGLTAERPALDHTEPRDRDQGSDEPPEEDRGSKPTEEDGGHRPHSRSKNRSGTRRTEERHPQTPAARRAPHQTANSARSQPQRRERPIPPPHPANRPRPPGSKRPPSGGDSTTGPSAPAPLSTRRAPTHPPVVMLHGFVDNRSVFVLLRRSLARHGWHHLECLNYSPLTCDIRAAAELLGRHIEEIGDRTGQDRVDIVGHSLGGLIARYYVQCLGGDLRVRTLITLGTPHSGTTVAPLASAHPIVRQMRPGSSVIEELSRPAPECRTRFVSFWSDLDQLMSPAETARLDHPDLNAKNVQVSGVGHLALPVHPAVAAGIRQALEPGAQVDTSGTASVA